MPHPFDYLRSLAELEDAELLRRLDDGSIEIVVSCSELLRPTALAPGSISSGNFVSEVHRLRDECRAGSRGLGDAIVESGELSDAGDRAAARRILTAFLASCQAPFYRRIAAARLAAMGDVDDG